MASVLACVPAAVLIRFLYSLFSSSDSFFTASLTANVSASKSFVTFRMPSVPVITAAASFPKSIKPLTSFVKPETRKLTPCRSPLITGNNIVPSEPANCPALSFKLLHVPVKVCEIESVAPATPSTCPNAIKKALMDSGVFSTDSLMSLKAKIIWSPLLLALIPNSFKRSNSPWVASKAASTNWSSSFPWLAAMSANDLSANSVGLSPRFANLI